MVTNVAYTQLDNVKHSVERFFQLQNGYIASQAFVWSAGKQSHVAIAVTYSYLD